MNKYFLTFFLCFFSYFSQAMDIKDSDFSPGAKVAKFVQKDPLNAFTYQLLRQSEKSLQEDPTHDGKRRLYVSTTAIWGKFKTTEFSQTDKKEMLMQLLDASSLYLTPNHQGRAISLGLIEQTIWDRSTLKFGPDITNLFKGLTVLGIVSTFIICPAAAAVVAGIQGTYRESCTVSKEEKFTSTDRNIGGKFVHLEAQCRYDRADHGVKTNNIVVPESGPCGFLHNINGTLIASDSYSLPQVTSTSENQVCPPLGGSFSLTCGRVLSEPYKSSDSRIPVGSVCKYTVTGCLKKGGSGKIDNQLHIPTNEVKCQGSKIENCDGELFVRNSGQSDHQCNDKYKSEL